MSRGDLFDYTFSVVQEEECLIWDTAITNPEKWLNEYCQSLEELEDEGSWMTRVVGRMLDTYKE